MRVLGFVAALICISHFTEACETEAEGVNNKFKKQIVKKHNEFRAKVANGKVQGLPKAANMLEMEWDENLAAKAQKWASKCVFEFSGDGSSGENIASNTNQKNKPVWKDVLQGFLNKEEEFNTDYVDSYKFQKSSSQFTQVIWAETNKIGCGYARYADGKNKKHLYGCRYSPKGNIIGHPIYEKGSPCSSCGGCGRKKGLCKKISRRRRSNEDDYNDEEVEEEYDDNSEADQTDNEEDYDRFPFLEDPEDDNDDISEIRGQSYNRDFGRGNGDDVDNYINEYDECEFDEDNENIREIREDDFDVYIDGDDDVEVGRGDDYYDDNDTYEGNDEENMENDEDDGNFEEENEDEDIE